MPSIQRARGVVSIEFALSFMALWLVTILLMDVGLRNYSTSVLNFAVSESARDVKVLDIKSEQEFERHFVEIIKQNSFSLWALLLKKGSLDVDVKRYASITALAANQPMNARDRKTAPIACYEIAYTYQPLMSFSIIQPSTIKRRVIAVQEGAKHAES
ncbi:TadE family protein [Vibrio sp. SCSIO 43136]|uniref:TadE family protein n=1 Tax=Vibrio sp. SCSIO 43136 TaxID=2819101 RepID=UPI002074F296|nr:TadE family protein [Vibrio sp. SCSIO 43136]USD66972.1 pilus assembly protein [Vibrio sp. SCSIO 43136]